MSKFVITVQRIVIENDEMYLEAETLMQALDTARAMVKTRNQTSTKGTYAVAKIQQVKESK